MRPGWLSLLCLAITSGVARNVPGDEVVIGVRTPTSEHWVSLVNGTLYLRVPAPAGHAWSADVEAHVSIPVVSGADVGVHKPHVTLALDGDNVTACRIPCVARLPGVAAGDHVLTATADEPWHGLLIRPCRFRLARLGEEAAQNEKMSDGPIPEIDVPSMGQSEAVEAGSLAADVDGRYAAILYPTDDACLTQTNTAYLSVSVTDGFFTLPRTHDILAKSETTVHCIVDENQQLQPAPMDYNPRGHGPLYQCSEYESEFTLKDGYVKRFDGEYAAGVPGAGQHDCPPGTICKHDLEDGFMIDIWLVVPEAGQTLQKDLLEGMHVSRFFLVDTQTRQQFGREATVTFFVDHGSGRVCRRAPLRVHLPGTSVLPRTAAADPVSGGSTDAAAVEKEEAILEAENGIERVMRLENVARRGAALQSSTAGKAVASLAIDGSTGVGGAAAYGDNGADGRPLGVSSRTQAEASPFWEVELAHAATPESLVIWAGLRSTGATGYPAFEVSPLLAPLRILLLDEERDIAAERVFDGSYADDEVLLWGGLETELRGVRVKVVRVQLEMTVQGAHGDMDEHDVFRELALREVQLWAWVPQGGGGAMCESSADCVYGDCVLMADDEGRAETGGETQRGSRGAGARGVCVCDTNWFGTHCDSSILHTSQYLPPATPPHSHRQGPRGCEYQGCEANDTMVDGPLLQRTIEEIELVQAAGEGGANGCSSEEAISFFFENRGLAASMLHMAGLLGFAFSQRRALVLSKRHPWVYTDGESCPQRDFQCYFEPFSKCQAVGGGVVREGSLLAGGRDNLVRDFNLVMPPALQHKGIFWWRLASVASLWRIRRDVLQELDIEAVKQSIGFEHPVIAMHVRRGDSCHTSLRRHRCRSLTANLRGVEAMAGTLLSASLCVVELLQLRSSPILMSHTARSHTACECRSSLQDAPCLPRDGRPHRQGGTRTAGATPDLHQHLFLQPLVAGGGLPCCSSASCRRAL